MKLRTFGLVSLLALVAPFGMLPASDAWVHPRNETFDAEKHYKAETGEIYY